MRPVEDFRNTPLIPISEKDLADHRRKVEEANRKGYYVEIKKDTIYYYRKFFSILSFKSDCDIIAGNDIIWICNDE